jgi:hypothetical protein
VATAVAIVSLITACTSSHAIPVTSTTTTPPSTAAPATASTAAPAVSGAAGIDPANLARVADILTTMHTHAFNPTAPVVKGNGQALPGGLYINWRGSWDGVTSPGANTNISTAGVSDEEAGLTVRHDPLTDLVYLRDLVVYRALDPTGPSFAADISRIEPIVVAEFDDYRFYRSWVYFELLDLDRYDPGRGWALRAQRMASAVAAAWSSTRGVILQASDGTYRPDYEAESAAMLVDAGKRFDQPTWITEGHATATQLLTAARDRSTGLFDGQIGANGTVSQAQMKVGEQAQLLNALLTVYDVTGDRALLDAVETAVTTMYAPQPGLHDDVNGGFFFGADTDGKHLRPQYKETRQGWMLPLLQHLEKIDGQQATRIDEMTTVVRDKLYRASSHGYVYRVAPDFADYQTQAGDENFVSTEAMGLAGQDLEGWSASVASTL